MNDVELRIMYLHEKIERNKKLSKELKAFAGVCLFFSIYYCLGTKSIGNIDKGQVIVTNLVWIISIIVLIGIYIKDSHCVKNNKACELDIYRLEVENLDDKKEIAKIRGEVLSDDVLNKQIDMPNGKVSLPIIYYSILLGIDIIIRIYLLINKIL